MVGHGKTVVGAAYLGYEEVSRADLVGREGMRLQAEVSVDQGHNARTDIEPVRIDIRKKSITA